MNTYTDEESSYMAMQAQKFNEQLQYDILSAKSRAIAGKAGVADEELLAWWFGPTWREHAEIGKH